MKIGFATIDITPEPGTELTGYGFYLGRKATGIHDNLHTRALFLKDSYRTEILILVCDLCGMDRQSVVRCKEKIEKQTGIPQKNISISTTHTHSGPATFFLRGLGNVDKNYLSSLEKKIVKASKKAKENAQEGEIGFIQSTVDISYNRVNKNGPVDKSLRIMAARNKNGKLFLFYNYNCHSVSLGRENTLISADWPYYCNERIKERGEGIFLQGFCGDINVKDNCRNDFEFAKTYGEILGEEILQSLGKIEFRKDYKIKAVSRIIDLPLEMLNEEKIEKIYEEMKKLSPFTSWRKFLKEWRKDMLCQVERNYRDFLPSEIQIFVFGKESCFFFAPGEIFTKFGFEIRNFSPFKHNFLVGYANDFVGYIPDEKDFERKGYAAITAPMLTGFLPFKKNVGAVLVEQYRKLLEEK